MEYICHQWAHVFFNYIRQGVETKGEYQVHRLVFAQRVESSIGAIFSVCEPICTSIAIGSTGVQVFIQGCTRAMGR